jgi:hypothetical protein
MATGAPASAGFKPAGVVAGAAVVASEGDNRAGDGRMGEVAPQAKIGVAIQEHLGVHRAVRVMAHGATFTHGFVFENERTFLGRVASGARFVL